MCGIVGIVSQNPVNESIYAALTLLQHRGQDAAGIVTIDDENRFRLRKANGLVSDVFRQEHMLRLQGHAGLGHVRYPTAGSSSVSEAQPFYVNSPYGLSLVHNGNLTNSTELKDKLFKRYSNPTALLHTYSMKETLDFLAYLFEVEAEEKLWELWLAKDIEQDFNSFKQERLSKIKQSSVDGKTMSQSEEEDAIRLAEQIMSMGVKEDG